MNQAALYIDGENFKYRIKEIIRKNNLDKEGLDFLDLDINKLFNIVLKDIRIDKKSFYSARLHFYKETKKKSKELIEEQRKLKRLLLNYGFDFITSGHVRLRESIDKILRRTTYVFYEKGVDVRIAVDIVSSAYEKKLSKIYLCSSDSDLQPAIHKAKLKGLEIIYIGFEDSPNIGLTKTTNKTILIRESDVLECFDRLDPWKKV